MVKLLNFRFDENHQHIFDIVNNLYVLVEKAVPKKNCLDMMYDASAGMNVFFYAPSRFVLTETPSGTLPAFQTFLYKTQWAVAYLSETNPTACAPASIQ